MTIEVFGPGVQNALWLALVGAALIFALGLGLRRKSIAAGALVLGTAISAFLAMHLLSALLVENSAPSNSDFNDYRWVILSPWNKAVVAFGAALCLLTAILTALATASRTRPWRSAVIIILRCGGLLAAFLAFVQPAVELRQVARNPNRIAILVDDSASMDLRDDPEGPTRRELAAATLQNSRDAFAAWEGLHLIDFYRFSENLAKTSLEQLSKSSSGKATLLRKALDDLRSDYRGDELAGVVILSDGVATGDLALLGEGERVEFAGDFDAPIHTLWTAGEGIKDVAINEVLADEFAFVRTVTRVEAIIHTTGFTQKRIPVTLSSEGKDLRRKWVEVEAGKKTASVVFEFTPSHVGKYVYKISTPVDPEEAIDSNNEAWFVVRVIRDKIRVLHVAGQPSWDVRALRGMLKQNPNVDLISFFILRTPDDIQKAGNEELSLIPFPTRELFQEELPSFDLVILHNFNYGPYGMQQYLENIRSYVEGGGGLIMLGGPLSFASGGYARTPLAKALPVELDSANAGPSALLDLGHFRPQLTKLGQSHPVSALRYQPEDNIALWESLPAWQGVNRVIRAKAGAAVLAVHPSLKDEDRRSLPVVIAGNYEKGRSLAITTDSLWHWDFLAAGTGDTDGRHYLKFWDNAIRWLIQDPELRYIHVSSDRNVYEPGDLVQLEVRVQDHDYSPLPNAPVTLTVREVGAARSAADRDTSKDDASLVAQEGLVTDASGTVTLSLPDAEPGVYRVHVQSVIRERSEESEDIYLVQSSSNETRQAEANARLLRELSTASEGSFAAASQAGIPSDLNFLAPKIVRVDQRREVPLWNLWWLILGGFTFLGGEWLLRQRSGGL